MTEYYECGCFNEDYEGWSLCQKHERLLLFQLVRADKMILNNEE